MERHKKSKPKSAVRPIWAKRADYLRTKRGMLQEEVAIGVGKIMGADVDVSRVKHWAQGDRNLKVDALCALADTLSCTPDYLLGYTESDSPQKDLQFICDYTGLSDDAISVLNQQKDKIPLLSRFINEFLLSIYREIIIEDIAAAIDCAGIADSQDCGTDPKRITGKLHVRQNIKEPGFVYADYQNIPEGLVVLNPAEAGEYYIDQSTRLFREVIQELISRILGGKNNE